MGKMSDGERLTLLERQVDFLLIAFQVVSGLNIAAALYFGLYGMIGSGVAFLVAIGSGALVPHLIVIWFHSRL